MLHRKTAVALLLISYEVILLLREQLYSVLIATKLLAGRPGNQGSIPGWGGQISLLSQHPDWL
jgi:hypothetical protein